MSPKWLCLAIFISCVVSLFVATICTDALPAGLYGEDYGDEEGYGVSDASANSRSSLRDSHHAHRRPPTPDTGSSDDNDDEDSTEKYADYSPRSISGNPPALVFMGQRMKQQARQAERLQKQRR